MKKVFCMMGATFLLLFGVKALLFSPLVAGANDGSQRIPNGPIFDPLRSTVCRVDCDFTSLQDAIDNIPASSAQTISILDSQLIESGIVIDQAKEVDIYGLGAHRTRIGFNDSSTPRTLTVLENATVSLNNLSLEGGDAGTDNGGALHVSGGSTTVTLNQVNVRDNKANLGGGITISDTATVEINQSNIDFNVAAAKGGGIHLLGGTLQINQSFVGYNSAAAGGGIYIDANASSASIKHSTIGHNAAGATREFEPDPQGGGGLFINKDGGTPFVEIDFSTISRNVSSDGNGGGILLTGDSVFLSNSIILNNQDQSGSDTACALENSSVVVGSNNLLGEESCSLGTNNVISNTAELGPLGDYGGPTPSFEILPESGAIGLVSQDACDDADQRGIARAEDDDRCDAGAFESEKFEVICDAFESCTLNRVKPDQLIVTKTDDPTPDGCAENDCSLREAIIAAENLPGRDTIVFAIDAPIELTLQGEGDASLGDLDIVGDIDIIGNITDVVTIDASELNDRIFEIMSDSVVRMTGLKLTGGNVSTGNRGGGAILNQGTFVGEHLLIRENSTTTGFGWGAGIQSKSGADLTLRHSEIISNSTTSFYSGINNWNSTMELTSVTVAGNEGLGAVIHNYASGGDSVLWINSATVASNGPSANFGLSNRWQNLKDNESIPEAAITYLRNSVIGHHSDLSCNGSGPVDNNFAKIVSHGYNLTFDETCTIDQPSDKPSTDPLLEPLAVNTAGKYNDRLILKPMPLSPLYNSGDISGCPAEDPRGSDRPEHGRCDIGAIELIEGPKVAYLPFVIR